MKQVLILPALLITLLLASCKKSNYSGLPGTYQVSSIVASNYRMFTANGEFKDQQKIKDYLLRIGVFDSFREATLITGRGTIELEMKDGKLFWLNGLPVFGASEREECSYKSLGMGRYLINWTGKGAVPGLGNMNEGFCATITEKIQKYPPQKLNVKSIPTSTGVSYSFTPSIFIPLELAGSRLKVPRISVVGVSINGSGSMCYKSATGICNYFDANGVKSLASGDTVVVQESAVILNRVQE